VNGGKDLEFVYNQSTAQLYHVSADNTFPYRLYSGQQESGRLEFKPGDAGEITFRDWQPVAAEEYGYVVADPLDPDIVIRRGKLTRFDRRTGQGQKYFAVPVQTKISDVRTSR